jgi:hypothetical protein
MLGNWTYFWNVGAGAGTAVDTWEDIYPSQFPQSNFLVYQGIASENQSYGDTPSLPPIVGSAQDAIIMGYKGFTISKSLMSQADDSIERIQLATLADYTWDDEQSKVQLDYYKDHLSDEGIELVHPAFAFDTDTENQFLQLSYLLDRELLDSGVELIQPAFAFDTDTENQLSSIGLCRDIVEEAPVTLITNFTWDVDYDSKPWSDSYKDHLSEEKFEFFTAPITESYDDPNDNQLFQLPYQLDRDSLELNIALVQPASFYDTDSDNQLLHLPYLLDRELLDSGVELVQPALAFDTDAENQLLQLPYLLDRELLDSGVELVQLPSFYDTDSDNQLLQLPYQLDTDIVDSCVELVQPAFAFDTDAESQFLQLPYLLDGELSEENVEYFIAPIVYDTDAENQLPQLPYQLDEDLSDTGVELLTKINCVTDIFLIDYKGYSVSRMLMVDQGFEWTNYIVLPVLTTTLTFDDPNDNQLFQLPYQLDTDLLDTGVEVVQFAIGTITGWDNDADNQLSQLPYQLDEDLSDTGVELLTQINCITDIFLIDYKGYSVSRALMVDQGFEGISLVTIPTFDDPNDNQLFQLSYQLDTDLLDSGVELVQLPSFYDTDSDNQLLQLPYLLDWELSEANVELIQPAFAFDTDSDSQLLQLPYQLDRELLDMTLVQAVSFNDTDAENQFLQLPYLLDRELLDSGVELVHPAFAFDTDAENQNLQLPYNKDHLSDEGVEILPALFAAVDMLLMGYRGYNISKALMLIADEGVEKITLNPIITSDTWDDQSEQSISNPGYYIDHLSDEGVENIIVIESYDTDTENQLLQPPYAVDRVLSDEGIEFVKPSYFFDTDFDSRQWVDYYKDHLSEEEVEFFINPIVYDTDAENQLLQLPYLLDKDLAETNVELVQPSFAFDTDADNQKLQLDYYKDHLLDEGIEILPTLFTAVDVTLMGYRGYNISKALMIISDEGVEQITLNPIVVSDTWDDISEQSIPNPNYYIDHLSDEGVEHIIITESYDTDAENQLFQLSYLLDRELLDSGVELVQPAIAFDTDTENQLLQLPYLLDRDVVDIGIALVQPAIAFDTDSDNQLLQLPYLLDRELAESNVEYFISPIGFDTDAENQKLQLDCYKDHLSDEGVEFVQYASGVITGWDTDAVYQQANPLPFSSDTITDEGVEKITLNPIVVSDTWDDVSEQSIPTPGYYKDHLLDEGVENIIVVKNYDTDAENQLFSLPYKFDLELADTGVELVEPVKAFDTDSDNQIPYLLSFSADTLTDENVERILLLTLDDITDQLPTLEYYKDYFTEEKASYFIAPIGLDNDIELQIQQVFWYQDLFDARNELPVIPIVRYDNDAEQQINPIGFSTDALSDEGIEEITLPAIVTTLTWDDVAEQSKAQPEYYKEHLSDEGTELVVRFTAWDNDVEYQLSQLVYQLDEAIVDASVELLPKLFSASDSVTLGYRGYSIPKSLMMLADEGVENITIAAPITEFTWDDISEHSMQQVGYYVDHLSDEGVENIIVIENHDTEAENQLFQLPYQLDRELLDSGVELRASIFGITDIFLIDYKGYSIPKVLMLEQEWTNYIILPTPGITSTQTWDNDAEQQFLTSVQMTDVDITDNGVEFITLPPFIDIIEIVGEEEE